MRCQGCGVFKPVEELIASPLGMICGRCEAVVLEGMWLSQAPDQETRPKD
jgi:hypothetical protein